MRTPVTAAALALLLGVSACATARVVESPALPTPSRLHATAQPSPRPLARHAVVAVGDSVPYGSACRCTPFPALVAAHLGTAQPLPAKNLALPGETSTQALTRLGSADAQRALADADLVLVTIGANDFDQTRVPSCSDPRSARCFGARLSALRSTMSLLLRRIHALMRPGGSVAVTGYWNVFLDGRVARALGRSYVANSDALTRAVNDVLASAAAREGMRYVDLRAAFKPTGDDDDTPLLAADGDHPNAEGHALIARAVLDALR